MTKVCTLSMSPTRLATHRKCVTNGWVLKLLTLPYCPAISHSLHNTSVHQSHQQASPFAILWHWFIVITLVVFDKPLSVNWYLLNSVRHWRYESDCNSIPVVWHLWTSKDPVSEYWSEQLHMYNFVSFRFRLYEKVESFVQTIRFFYLINCLLAEQRRNNCVKAKWLCDLHIRLGALYKRVALGWIRCFCLS